MTTSHNYSIMKSIRIADGSVRLVHFVRVFWCQRRELNCYVHEAVPNEQCAKSLLAAGLGKCTYNAGKVSIQL